MFLRMDQGTAESEDGHKYDVSTNIGGGNPIIHSQQTGRVVTLSWAELIDLAIAAGIDSKDPMPEEGKELDLSIRSHEERTDTVPVS